jgi:uncharacterized OsmC-like protein
MTQNIQIPTNKTLNGLDVATLEGIAGELMTSPEKARASFATRTCWTGGVTTRSTVEHWTLGGERLERDFEIRSDEPPELLGGGEAPNPQELLLSAVAACMTVTYAVTAATMGIAIDDLEIEMAGALDLRGPMGLVDDLRRGFPDVDCKVHIRADASPSDLAALHDQVLRTSANVENLTKAIPLKAKLVVEGE